VVFRANLLNARSSEAKAVSTHAERKDHTRSSLSEEDLNPDPIRQFELWYDDARQSESAEFNAMTLATSSPGGRPSARMVLLRGADERGFSFFTNYESRKAMELEANPFAALVFFWHELERQVRIEGRVERVSPAESDRYFEGRPRGARIGAWASPQSQVVAGREILDSRYLESESRHPGETIPRPPNWGGYRLIPDSIEFWQGRPNRLHDRLRYTLRPGTSWLIERLAP
jgi:pyridoxamine 5'-phosphate oxidase